MQNEWCTEVEYIIKELKNLEEEMLHWNSPVKIEVRSEMTHEEIDRICKLSAMTHAARVHGIMVPEITVVT